MIYLAGRTLSFPNPESRSAAGLPYLRSAIDFELTTPNTGDEATAETNFAKVLAKASIFSLIWDAR